VPCTKIWFSPQAAGNLPIEIEVIGKVQGVGFRYYILEHANMLGLTGYVKNLANGHVFIEAEGEPGSIEQLKHYCEQGPVRARVSSCIYELNALRYFKDFCIK
jgi:acylphosphatase